MASGMVRSFSGAVTGTGSAIDVRKVGFRPTSVDIWNVAAGGLVQGTWLEGMADASMIKRSILGDMTVPLTNGVTPLSDGFRIGADADMNVSGELIRFRAIG